jgi:DNA-3-methyladenine glycosylase
MAARRGVSDPKLLAKGPARLCQAYGLVRVHNGLDLCEGDLWVGADRILRGPVRTSMRIGVKPEINRPWRFYEAGPFTSGGKASVNLLA